MLMQRASRRLLSSYRFAPPGTSIVPVIDFEPFLKGNRNERNQVARQVIGAYKTVGFAAFSNHSVPLPLVKRAFGAALDFFQLPPEEKNALAWTSPESNRGYVRQGHELAQYATMPDLKETFEIGNEKETEFPNHWPTRPGIVPHFKPIFLEFYKSADLMHLEVLRCIALGLDLPEEFFTPLCNEGHQNCRLLHYPRCPRSLITDTQQRGGAHTDYGSITLLFQHEKQGGLHVLNRDSEWVSVEPIPDTVVVNIGDCLQRWSNDVLRSNLHQVLADPNFEGEDLPGRQSIAFFCNPNKSTQVECLPTCFSETNPAKYAPINAYDYLCGRLSATIQPETPHITPATRATPL